MKGYRENWPLVYIQVTTAVTYGGVYSNLQLEILRSCYSNMRLLPVSAFGRAALVSFPSQGPPGATRFISHLNTMNEKIAQSIAGHWQAPPQHVKNK